MGKVEKADAEITIAVCVTPLKWKKLRFDHFVQHCSRRNWKLLHVTDEDDFIKYDVILHKLRDFDPPHLRQHFLELIKVNRSSIILDPLESSSLLTNRQETSEVCLAAAKMNNELGELFVPVKNLAVAIEDGMNLRFPIICKPVVSQGARNDHLMHIAFNLEQIQHVSKLGCYTFQPFINHSAYLHKVYVIGTEVFVAGRRSVKNLPESNQESHLISFNTAEVSKLTSSSSLTEDCIPTVSDESTVRRIVSFIAETLNVSIFGVDIIIDKYGKHFVIDVNYFPGFSDIYQFLGEERVFCSFERAIELAISRNERPVLQKDYHITRFDFKPRVSSEAKEKV